MTEITCDVCSGTGKISFDNTWVFCPECMGKGKRLVILGSYHEGIAWTRTPIDRPLTEEEQELMRKMSQQMNKFLERRMLYGSKDTPFEDFIEDVLDMKGIIDDGL